MKITGVETGERLEVIVSPVIDKDFNILTKKRYLFPWKEWKDKAWLYKLCTPNGNKIFGVMALIDVPEDKRMEIKLLASSIENVGKKKRYNGIAGCLIAYACRESVIKYADLACVSLVPKTKLKNHYVKKYNMIDSGGKQVYLDGKSLNDLIVKYLL